MTSLESDLPREDITKDENTVYDISSLDKNVLFVQLTNDERTNSYWGNELDEITGSSFVGMYGGGVFDRIEMYEYKSDTRQNSYSDYDIEKEYCQLPFDLSNEYQNIAKSLFSDYLQETKENAKRFFSGEKVERRVNVVIDKIRNTDKELSEKGKSNTEISSGYVDILEKVKSVNKSYKITAKSELLISEIRRLSDNGSVGRAVDLVFEEVDRLLREHRYDWVAEILDRVNVENYPRKILLALLTITLPAKSKLENRIEFLEKVTSEIDRRGEYEEGLFSGLR